MWRKEYNRNVPPPADDSGNFGVITDSVSILKNRGTVLCNQALEELHDRTLPAAPAFGFNAGDCDLNYLQECRVSFAAGCSDPLPGFMFTPDHAFLLEHNSELSLISETLWHSQLFNNKYVRCDK